MRLIVLQVCEQLTEEGKGAQRERRPPHRLQPRFQRRRSPPSAACVLWQIKKCKTDSVKGVGYDPERPEANNLLGIYEAMTGQTREQACWRRAHVPHVRASRGKTHTRARAHVAVASRFRRDALPHTMTQF